MLAAKSCAYGDCNDRGYVKEWILVWKWTITIKRNTMVGCPFSCSYSVNRFSRYLLLKAHNDPLKIWTATHTFSLLMLTQLTMAVNGLLLRQCVSKAIFKLTAYTSEFKFLLKQIINYYILIFWVIKLYFLVISTVLAHFWKSCHFNSPQVQQFLRYFWLTYTAVIYSLLWI